jgi:hypothetical protein
MSLVGQDMVCRRPRRRATGSRYDARQHARAGRAPPDRLPSQRRVSPSGADRRARLPLREPFSLLDHRDHLDLSWRGFLFVRPEERVGELPDPHPQMAKGYPSRNE